MFSMPSMFGHNCIKDDASAFSSISIPAGEVSIRDIEQVVQVDQKSIENAFVRVFSTDDGQLVLSHLQSITFQRALGPDAPDAQLRYMEGQRAMIATIMRLIRSGRAEGVFAR